MKKYDQYKNSGVEWLGEIPEHWELKRFKFITNIQKGKLPRKIVTTNEFNLPPYMSMEYLRGGEENQWVFDRDAKIIDENETLLLWDGSNAGEFIKSRKGVISSTVAEIEFKNIHNSFAWFYSKFLEIELRKKTIGMGIPHVNGTELKNFSVALPPIKEQILIANFLENKTTKIDQAIAIKQKQIELLKERRQILIHKAVTRGLNENVKLKDSGVEWIGEIPEHWGNTKIKAVAKTTSGATPPSGNLVRYYNGQYPWIRTTDLNNGILNEVPEYITAAALRDTACKIIPKNTICIAMYGGGGTIGKFALVNFDNATLNQAVCGIRGNIEINYLFLYYSLQMMRKHWMFYADGSRKDPNISQDIIKNMPIVYPHLAEQKLIVEYIEISNTKIATAISLKEQEIEKLKEYKMSLIDGVVTGKVKVC
jgi:type I restriction enzyme S subunit